MTDHPLRDIELSFGGKTFTIRPAFEVIASIEDALDNTPARTLGLRCVAAAMPTVWRTNRDIDREITTKELAIIMFYALRGQDGAPKSVNAAGEIIMYEGFQDLAIPLGNYLVRSKIGHKEHEREAQMLADRRQREAEAGIAPVDPPKS